MKEKIKISYNEKNDSYKVCYNGFSWVSDGSKSRVSVCKSINGKKNNKDILFKSAKSRKTEYSDKKL